MSKKPPRAPDPPAPRAATTARVRIEEPPWNSSVAGVLGEATKRNTLHRFADVIVIGVHEDGAMDVLTSSRDRFRLIGVVRAALDLVARPRS